MSDASPVSSASSDADTNALDEDFVAAARRTGSRSKSKPRSATKRKRSKSHRHRKSSSAASSKARSASHVKGERYYTAQKRTMLNSMRRGGQKTRRGTKHSDAVGTGSKYEVFFGLKKCTAGRLEAPDLLLVAKTGKVVSARKYENGVKRYKAQMKDPAFADDWEQNKKQ